MKRDLKSDFDTAILYVPSIFGTTGTGSAVDLKGYDSCMVVFSAGSLGAAGTSIVPTLLESADGTTFGTVGTASLQGTFTVTGTGVASYNYRVGYIGTGRYIKPVLTGIGGTGAATGQMVSMVAIRGHAARKPLA